MASFKTVKEIPGVGAATKRVTVRKVTSGGRLQGRYCVKASLFVAPRAMHARKGKQKETCKRGSKGACLAPVEMHGCFVSQNEAYRVAAKLARR